ncbi:MAG TPA: dihydrodipicolinate synthase family protein [Terracidiphilus sp.]|nr:dihydrodipicolinate synthase family protein [Terracidiphilus sp.]
MLLEGIFAAVTTPFYSDERVYFPKLEHNMERYSRSLLAGMVVLGSTGEAVSLDDAESRDVLRTAAEATAPEKVLIAGVGKESVKGTVEMAEAAAAFHYDAVLVRTPSYYRAKISDPAAVLNYFRSVADRSPLPVILYNIPQNVPYELPITIIGELAQHPNIIGIKDSQGVPERIPATVEATRNAPRRSVTVTPVFEAVTARMLMQKPEPPGGFVPADILAGGAAVAAAPPAPALKTRTREVGFQTMVGSGTGVFAGLQAGACGAVLAFAACAPQACCEIYIAWKEHDLKLAEEKQQRIVEAVKRICVGMGLSGLKYACDFNGYYGGRCRSPLLPATAEQKTEVERVLAEIRN